MKLSISAIEPPAWDYIVKSAIPCTLSAYQFTIDLADRVASLRSQFDPGLSAPRVTDLVLRDQAELRVQDGVLQLVTK